MLLTPQMGASPQTKVGKVVRTGEMPSQTQQPAAALDITNPETPELTKAQSILEGLGLLRPKAPAPQTTAEVLVQQELTVNSTLEHLGDLIRNSQSESVKIQAIKMLMEMHQLLRPATTGSQMSIVVNIVDTLAKPEEVNPILIPRVDPSILEPSALEFGLTAPEARA